MNDTSAEEAAAVAIWRLEPDESFSDWKIKIVCDTAASVYHVHKNYLALGPRKSEYFVRVFRHAGSLGESSTTSMIHLKQPAAQLFSYFLDYIYTGRLDFDESDAVVMYHFGHYFDVGSLAQAAKEYLRSSLDEDNLRRHLRNILLFRDTDPMDMAITRCAQVWLGVHTRELFHEELDYDFVLEVMKLCGHVIRSRDLFAQTDSSALSCCLADWLTAHEDELDADKLLSLTDKRLLPSIYSGMALKYLKIQEPFVDSVHDFSCLRERCIHAIGVDDFARPQEEEDYLINAIHSLSQPELARLLLSSLARNTRPRRDFYEGPHHIFVKGASLATQDSTFKLEEGMFNGCFKYKSYGLWEGTPRKFMIMRDEDSFWSIVVSLADPDDDNRVPLDEEVLYQVEAPPSKYPPSWGWYCPYSGPGSAPPIFLFRQNDGEEERVEQDAS